MAIDKKIRGKLLSCAGIIVGADGRGGSGTFVQLKDGQIALLTAKHVVLECIRATGEAYIAAPYFEEKLRRPQMIRMDSSQQADAAFAIFSDPSPKMQPIPYCDWTTDVAEIKIGDPVLACGFPGSLRQVSGRSIKPIFGSLNDRVRSRQGHTIVCGINELNETLPTFAGMSGGGLFSHDGRFLGIIVNECRKITPTHGEIHSLIPSGYAELYREFKLPCNPPKGGYIGMKRSIALRLFNADGSTRATVGCLGEFLLAQKDLTHPYARFGRMLTLEFIFPNGDVHYPVNIESLFTWEEDTEEGMLAALYEEFRFLLMRMGWLVSSEEPDGTSYVQVKPLM
ncbi:MAG: serine protease [Elusimicrobiales bacterium]|nr:serine protease [Elusimicrobiales bacterium]